MAAFVLVTGATGQQGGATARALLAAGEEVHALVRDPQAPRAVALGEAGATLVPGNLDDVGSLRAALDGARGVFSVQTPDLADLTGDAEGRHAQNLAEAIRAAGTEQVVHTSVAGAGRGPVDPARWGVFLEHYWRTKAEAEAFMRDAAARRWTVLRPSLFLENFVRPSIYFSDPARPDHLFVTLDLDLPQPVVAVDDIGAAAAAAFADPERFDRVELELAGDLRPVREVAAILSRAWGTEITLPASPAQARAEGLVPELATAQEHMNAHPSPARPEYARALGLPTTTVEQWAHNGSRA